MKSVYFDLLWYYRTVAFPETIYNVQVIPKWIWHIFREIILWNLKIFSWQDSDQAHIKNAFVFSVFTLTGKPNSTHDSADGEEDGK